MINKKFLLLNVSLFVLSAQVCQAVEVSDATALKNALSTGGEVVITQDIVLNSNLGTFNSPNKLQIKSANEQMVKIDGKKYYKGITNEGTASFENILFSQFAGKNMWQEGSAINNEGTITTISGAFEDNSNVYVSGTLNNRGTIHNIAADFRGNSSKQTDYWAVGGALYNAIDESIIGQISGKFIGNYAKNNGDKDAAGGAIETHGTIESIINSYFEGNYTHNDQGWSHGGGVDNEGGSIQKIEAEFVDNHVYSGSGSGGGGAIALSGRQESYTGTINGTFKQNYVQTDAGQLAGGAVMVSEGKIDSLSGTFDGNYGKAVSGNVYGGAVGLWSMYDYTEGGGNIGTLEGEFTNNSVSSESGQALGGAIYIGKMNSIGKIKNSTFVGNSADTAGGAIYALSDVNIEARHFETLFSGNTANGESNAIYMDKAEETAASAAAENDAMKTLNLTAAENGAIVFEDDINGVDYNVSLNGDESGEIVFNGKVSGAAEFSANAGAVYHLGKNAVVDTVNYKSDNATLKLDIAVGDNSVQNGIINVSGEVIGNTKVIVNAENPAGFKNAKTMFVNAANFEGGTAEQFEVSRVIGSPYMWHSVVNAGGEESGSHWYLSLADENAPEVAAYAGLQSAAVEQNRSIADSVANGLAGKKSTECYQESCGVAEIMPQKQAWIDVTYENAEIETPADMDAKISGTTLGLDLYRDTLQRAGVFGAYRHGKYDLSGKGKYYAAIESDITNKSYLGGAYYQFDNDDVRLTGTVFAGKQDMDIKTDDHIVKTSTDAMQYGASAEAAKRYAISERVNLEPSLGLYYSMIDVDDLHDNVGKSAQFDTLHYLEAELGAKLEYVFCRKGCTNRVYAKPSVIRTFTSGAETHISGLDNVKSYKDMTLGRMEFGGEFGFNDRWTGYAATGYTFGDDYKSYDVNLGVGYRF